MSSSTDQFTPETKRQKEVERLRKLVEMRPEADDGFRFQGLLLSDAIETCVKAFRLIEPFNPENLKAASYKLTIGDAYAVAGRMIALSDETGKNEVKIRPFEVAIIKTHETINMPRFLIGRWNIQVKRAYKGLIWVGGPQVDPGYVGHLFCPLYNLSDQDVVLFKGDSIAVIDFVGTTAFDRNKSKSYRFPPELVLFEEYEPQKLVSGLVSQAKNRLDQVEGELRAGLEKSGKQVKSIDRRVNDFIILTFAVMAILFAALAVSAFGKESPPWPYISIFLLSGLSIFVAASTWVRARDESLFLGRWLQLTVFLVLVGAFIFDMFVVTGQRRQIQDLRADVQSLKSAVAASTGLGAKAAPGAVRSRPGNAGAQQRH